MQIWEIGNLDIETNVTVNVPPEMDEQTIHVETDLSQNALSLGYAFDETFWWLAD